MNDDFLSIELDYPARSAPVPCPNCKKKLDRKVVLNDESVNAGRPYVVCDTCSCKGKICFWFLDRGVCNLCNCPMYQGPAKNGKHAGKMFQACSQGCPGKFRWLKQ